MTLGQIANNQVVDRLVRDRRGADQEQGGSDQAAEQVQRQRAAQSAHIRRHTRHAQGVQDRRQGAQCHQPGAAPQGAREEDRGEEGRRPQAHRCREAPTPGGEVQTRAANRNRRAEDSTNRRGQSSCHLVLGERESILNL